MAVYCNSLEFPLSPHIDAPGKLKPAAERGKKIFFSKEVGCATCHSGPYFTDSSLKKPFNLHDVGTGRADQSERMGTEIRHADAARHLPRRSVSARRLGSDLARRGHDPKQGGQARQDQPTCKSGEIDDLVEFLKSLPYETPPDVTPNTVEYRLQPGKKGQRQAAFDAQASWGAHLRGQAMTGNAARIQFCNHALESVTERIPASLRKEVHGYINHVNEWGLGMETLVDGICESGIMITKEQFSLIDTAMRSMDLDESDRMAWLREHNVVDN